MIATASFRSLPLRLPRLPRVMQIGHFFTQIKKYNFEIVTCMDVRLPSLLLLQSYLHLINQSLHFPISLCLRTVGPCSRMGRKSSSHLLHPKIQRRKYLVYLHYNLSSFHVTEMIINSIKQSFVSVVDIDSVLISHYEMVHGDWRQLCPSINYVEQSADPAPALT